VTAHPEIRSAALSAAAPSTLAATTTKRSFAVTGATSASQLAALAAAGCTHVVLAARWDLLAPRGPTAALDQQQVASVRAIHDSATAAGLAVVLDHQLQSAPGWVRRSVEPFTDQHGVPFKHSGAAVGLDVRNWMWTSVGRAYVAVFVDRLAGALGPARRRATAALTLGGGWSGYLQYPQGPSRPPFRYWGYGRSMQTGNGLARDPLLRACPLPGYVPFTRGPAHRASATPGHGQQVIAAGTDADDVTWIDWYLDGIESWVNFGIRTFRSAGYGADILVAHPPQTVRADQNRTQAAYRASMAIGADAVRVVARYAPVRGVWPLAASLTDPDGAATVRTDSQQSTWKKIAAEATLRGKGAGMWGGNADGDSGANLRFVFREALTASPSAGRPLQVGRALILGDTPTGAYQGYTGLVWSSYPDLAVGGAAGHASIDDLRAAIGTAPPRQRTWAAGVHLDDGDPSAVRAFAATTYPVTVEAWYADASGSTEAAGWSRLLSNITSSAPKAFQAPCLNLVSMPLIPAIGGNSPNNALLRTAGTGAHTAHWTAVGRALAGAGFDDTRTILRLGWEPNGSWYPWSTENQPTLVAAYRSAFSHAVTALRSVLKQRVQFDLCINSGTDGATAAADHFPGAAYVDIIGLDHFDWFPGSVSDAAWAQQNGAPSFAETAALARRYGKRWSLDEWACSDVASHGAGDNPAFIQRVFDELRSLGPLVSHDCYFDFSGPGNHDLAHNPRAAALYQKLWSS
jgi:hypothetical protein